MITDRAQDRRGCRRRRAFTPRWVRAARRLSPRKRGAIAFFTFLSLVFFDGLLSNCGNWGSTVGAGVLGLGMLAAWWCLYPPMGCLASMGCAFGLAVMLIDLLSWDVLSSNEVREGVAQGGAMVGLGVAGWLIVGIRARFGEGKEQTERVFAAVARSRHAEAPPDAQGLLRPAVSQPDVSLLRAHVASAEDVAERLLRATGKG